MFKEEWWLWRVWWRWWQEKSVLTKTTETKMKTVGLPLPSGRACYHRISQDPTTTTLTNISKYYCHWLDSTVTNITNISEYYHHYLVGAVTNITNITNVSNISEYYRRFLGGTHFLKYLKCNNIKTSTLNTVANLWRRKNNISGVISFQNWNAPLHIVYFVQHIFPRNQTSSDLS